VLDEPTGDLDSVNTAIVMKLLTDLNKEGITLVMVTHDVGLKFFADRIIWMRDGKIQRTEIVPTSKKAEIQQKLESNLRDIGIHKLSDEATGRKITFRATEVRKPQSYSTYSSRLDELMSHEIVNVIPVPVDDKSQLLVKRESQLGLIGHQY